RPPEGVFDVARPELLEEEALGVAGRALDIDGFVDHVPSAHLPAIARERRLDVALDRGSELFGAHRAVEPARVLPVPDEGVALDELRVRGGKIDDRVRVLPLIARRSRRERAPLGGVLRGDGVEFAREERGVAGLRAQRRRIDGRTEELAGRLGGFPELPRDDRLRALVLGGRGRLLIATAQSSNQRRGDEPRHGAAEAKRGFVPLAGRGSPGGRDHARNTTHARGANTAARRLQSEIPALPTGIGLEFGLTPEGAAFPDEAQRASVGDREISSLSRSRGLTWTRFSASTMTTPTPSRDSASASPFSGPRMNTASSMASAVRASGAQTVTLRDAVAG